MDILGLSNKFFERPLSNYHASSSSAAQQNEIVLPGLCQIRSSFLRLHIITPSFSRFLSHGQQIVCQYCGQDIYVYMYMYMYLLSRAKLHCSLP